MRVAVAGKLAIPPLLLLNAFIEELTGGRSEN